jgi:hypothetical protein
MILFAGGLARGTPLAAGFTKEAALFGFVAVGATPLVLTLGEGFGAAVGPVPDLVGAAGVPPCPGTAPAVLNACARFAELPIIFVPFVCLNEALGERDGFTTSVVVLLRFRADDDIFVVKGVAASKSRGGEGFPRVLIFLL